MYEFECLCSRWFNITGYCAVQKFDKENLVQNFVCQSFLTA